MKKQAHFESSHIKDLLTSITNQKKTRLELFATYNLADQAAVFNDLPATIQQDILDTLPSEILIPLLDHFDLFSAGQYIRRIKDVRRQKSIAKRLKKELYEKTEQFLRFHPKAAAHIISYDYILLSHTKTISEAADAAEMHYLETGRHPEVLVRKDGICVGKVLPATLIREANTETIQRFISPVTTILYNASPEDILNTCKDTNEVQLVVLDTDESVVGIVYVRDVQHLMSEYKTESLYEFANVQDTEHVSDSIYDKINSRAKWLLINLATVFLAASVVALFEDTIAAIVALAIYMPVIIGMGSNAGTQTLAVFVRGIALGEVHSKNSLSAVRNEIVAVALQGIIHGTIVTVVATLLGHGWMLGLVVAIAIWVNLIVGVTVGALMPLLMKKLGKDPAQSSGVILTTLTDVSGLLVLFALATIFLL